MKKMLIGTTTLMVALSLPVPLLAEAGVPGESAFFDWAYLATYSGAVAAVVFIVQFLKLPADRIGRVPTRALVYGVALMLLLAAQAAAGALNGPKDAALAALNAVLVAFTAMGVYERAIALPEARKGEAQTQTGGED